MTGHKPSATSDRWRARTRALGQEMKSPGPGRRRPGLLTDGRRRGAPGYSAQQPLNTFREAGDVIQVTFLRVPRAARQCEWYAAHTNDEEDRKFLLRKAKEWTKLAREKEQEAACRGASETFRNPSGASALLRYAADHVHSGEEWPNNYIVEDKKWTRALSRLVGLSPQGPC